MKLEELKKEIQRLLPEIMELKFGCKLKNNFAPRHKPYIFLKKKNKNQWVVWMEQFNEDGVFDIKNHFIEDNNDTFEILGRDITLEDCLRALKKKNLCWVVSSFGILEEARADRPYKMSGEPMALWKLGKPLDKQPQEVISLLHKLIVNNKIEK